MLTAQWHEHKSRPAHRRSPLSPAAPQIQRSTSDNCAARSSSQRILPIQSPISHQHTIHDRSETLTSTETNVFPGTSTLFNASSNKQTGSSSSLKTPPFNILFSTPSPPSPPSSPPSSKNPSPTHCNGTRFVGLFSSSRRSKARLIWNTKPLRTSPVAWISTPRSGVCRVWTKYAQWSLKGWPL